MKEQHVRDYSEAVQAARAGYWVEPIVVDDDEQDQWFNDKFRVADKSVDGLVHYESK